MSYPIILNSTNVTGTGRLEYIFPSAVKFGADDEIAIQSISLYNSIFNIEAVRGNNMITATFNALVPETAVFKFDDGFYDVPSINSFIQQQCMANKWYMLDGAAEESTTNHIYFLELLINSNLYGVQLNSYALPTAANAATLGYSKPAGATWDFPATNQSMQLTITTESFGNLIGFNTGIYPATIQTTTQNILNVKSPQISPVNSIIVGCNLISSPLAVPSHLFYALAIDAGFGSMIKEKAGSPAFNKIAAGHYGRIIIDLLDQNFSNLRINDKEMVIVLSVRLKQK